MIIEEDEENSIWRKKSDIQEEENISEEQKMIQNEIELDISKAIR